MYQCHFADFISLQIFSIIWRSWFFTFIESDSFTFSVFITEELDKKITVLCTLLVPNLKIAHMHTLNSLKTLISHGYVSKREEPLKPLKLAPSKISYAIRIFQFWNSGWSNQSFWNTISNFENFKCINW